MRRPRVGESLSLSEVVEVTPSSSWVLLQLEVVTPLIGGGVDPKTPDVVDRVRVPGIRGQLRAFWRALGASTKERDVWGGIGQSAQKSLVRVSIDAVNQPGHDAPAGTHTVNLKNGNLRPAADWKQPRLGYGLFPLQIPQEALRQAPHGASGVDTASVRKGLGFMLRISWRAEVPAEELLTAVWFWTHFGGLGARVSRGFGSLRVAKFECSGDVAAHWSKRFADEGFEAHLAALRPTAPSTRADVRCLRGVKVFLGPGQATPDAAHELLVDSLRAFRQGPNIGRDPGQSNQPGVSRWPEPEVLRRAAEARGVRERWEHPPRRLMQQDLRNLVTPRAAFGLPLIVKFKHLDKADARASGTLNPFVDRTVLGRWSSPLTFRVLRSASGQWHPMIVVYGDRPEEVALDPQAKGSSASSPQTFGVAGTAGAAAPIDDALRAAAGDAVMAFVNWMRGRAQGAWREV